MNDLSRPKILTTKTLNELVEKHPQNTNDKQLISIQTQSQRLKAMHLKAKTYLKVRQRGVHMLLSMDNPNEIMLRHVLGKPNEKIDLNHHELDFRFFVGDEAPCVCMQEDGCNMLFLSNLQASGKVGHSCERCLDRLKSDKNKSDKNKSDKNKCDENKSDKKKYKIHKYMVTKISKVLIVSLSEIDLSKKYDASQLIKRLTASKHLRNDGTYNVNWKILTEQLNCACIDEFNIYTGQGIVSKDDAQIVAGENGKYIMYKVDIRNCDNLHEIGIYQRKDTKKGLDELFVGIGIDGKTKGVKKEIQFKDWTPKNTIFMILDYSNKKNWKLFVSDIIIPQQHLIFVDSFLKGRLVSKTISPGDYSIRIKIDSGSRIKLSNCKIFGPPNAGFSNNNIINEENSNMRNNNNNFNDETEDDETEDDASELTLELDDADKMQNICDVLNIEKGVNIEVNLYGFVDHLTVYKDIYRLAQIEDENQRNDIIRSYNSNKLRDIKSKIKCHGTTVNKKEIIEVICKQLMVFRNYYLESKSETQNNHNDKHEMDDIDENTCPNISNTNGNIFKHRTNYIKSNVIGKKRTYKHINNHNIEPPNKRQKLNNINNNSNSNQKNGKYDLQIGYNFSYMTLYPNTSIYNFDNMKYIATIGVGTEGYVHCMELISGAKVALKSGRGNVDVTKEYNLLKDFNHPNILKPKVILKHCDINMIIFDLMNGDVFNLLLDTYLFQLDMHVGGSYAGNTNNQLKLKMVVDICNALKYIHAKKFNHRDIKLENILYKIMALGKNRFGIKFYLGDWGGVAWLTDRIETVGVAGTWPYVRATEFKSITAARDMYQLGITLWTIINGDFDNNDICNWYEPKDMQHIQPSVNKWQQEIYNKCGPINMVHIGSGDTKCVEMGRLLKGLLELDADKRWTACDVLNDEFVKASICDECKPVNIGRDKRFDELKPQTNNIQFYINEKKQIKIYEEEYD